MEIPSNSNDGKHTRLYLTCLLNVSCNKPQNIQTVRPSSQGHYSNVSTPLSFVMRLHKCYGKQPNFDASIIFLMGCLSSSPGPLALQRLSRCGSLLLFLPSSKVKRYFFSLLKSINDFVKNPFSLHVFGLLGPRVCSLSYT